MVLKHLFEAFRGYFRIEVEGLEHIPKRGRVLIISNHSGCSGLDALMLGYILRSELRRIPRILALWSLLGWLPQLERTAQKMGLMPASTGSLLELLRKNRLTVIFPEGVYGSFKPTSERYRLQPFRTGFVRSSLLSDAPVIPCVVIGAEEANINWGMFQFRGALGSIFCPVPLNIIPFPTKWKIRFLPPADLSHWKQEDADDREKMKEAAEHVRTLMQRVIVKELDKRKYVFFEAS